MSSKRQHHDGDESQRRRSRGPTRRQCACRRPRCRAAQTPSPVVMFSSEESPGQPALSRRRLPAAEPPSPPPPENDVSQRRQCTRSASPGCSAPGEVKRRACNAWRAASVGGGSANTCGSRCGVQRGCRHRQGVSGSGSRHRAKALERGSGAKYFGCACDLVCVEVAGKLVGGLT